VGVGECVNWPPDHFRPTFATTVVWQDTQSPVPPLAWSNEGLPTAPTGRSFEWQVEQVAGVPVTFVWNTPLVVRAVEVPLATLSVTQFAQFAVAAAVSWQPVQSGSVTATWLIWFLIVLLIEV
jgi:hypothetical protein